MTRTLDITLPRLHPAQREIAHSTARFRVAVCGRRFGKTLYAAGEALIAASKGGRVWWIAPTYDVTRRGWAGVVGLAKQIPGADIRRGVREMVLPGGGFVAFKTADSEVGLKGEGLDLAIFDEAAYVRPDAWAQDIRPALSDRLGRALFISTPNGRNWFFTAYLHGVSGDHSDWQSWRFPTSANPFIRPDEIEAARDLLPARIFEQEYLAEFVADGGAVFRNLAACTSGTAQDGPQDGHAYVFGVDWGRSEDFTVIAVMDRDERRLVALDSFNQVGWSLQRGRLAALAATWHPDAIYAEENSIGGPNIEALQADGLPVMPFTTTAASKGPLIESLALAFEKGEIRIFEDAGLIGELQAYTMDRLPSGRFAYSAPAGLHDDRVIALALAWHGVDSPLARDLIAFV